MTRELSQRCVCSTQGWGTELRSSRPLCDDESSRDRRPPEGRDERNSGEPATARELPALAGAEAGVGWEVPGDAGIAMPDKAAGARAKIGESEDGETEFGPVVAAVRSPVWRPTHN